VVFMLTVGSQSPFGLCDRTATHKFQRWHLNDGFGGTPGGAVRPPPPPRAGRFFFYRSSFLGLFDRSRESDRRSAEQPSTRQMIVPSSDQPTAHAEFEHFRNWCCRSVVVCVLVAPCMWSRAARKDGLERSATNLKRLGTVHFPQCLVRALLLSEAREHLGETR
jgi:hypothetical protein